MALALCGNSFDNNSQTAEELRRTIQLAPRFAKAYGQLAKILREDRKPEAVVAARKAIELDHNTILGHVVILMDFIARKDYAEATRTYRQMRMLELKWDGEDAYENGYAMGVLTVATDQIFVGLIRTGKPFEAYRLFVEDGTGGTISTNGHPDDVSVYNPACAAALAGTGQGQDAPPAAEWPAIRKHAMEWLTSRLDIWKKHATAVPAWAASSVGLLSTPSGLGPFQLASVLLAGKIDLSAERANDLEVVHNRMNEWLGDADLLRVRDDQWLAKLPGEERAQWQKLWADVRSLRDRTAPAKIEPVERGPMPMITERAPAAEIAPLPRAPK